MSIARKGLLLSIGTYLTLVVGIGQAMILSRALGPEGVGELAIYRQTFLVSLQLLSLGLPMAMIRLINSKAIPPLQAKVFFCKIGIGTGFVAAVLVCLFLWIMSGSLFPNVVPLIYIGAAVWITTVTLRATLYNYCAAMLWAKALAIISVLPPLLLVGIYGALWLFAELSVTTAVLLEAVCLGAFSMVLAWFLVRRGPAPKESMPDLAPEELRQTVWEATPFGLQLMATDILVILNGYLMLVILRTFSDDFAEVGYFTRGLRLATIGVLAVQSLQRLLYANWAKLEGDRRKRSVENVVNFSIMIMIPIAAMVIVAAKPLTILLFGEKFLPSVPVTRVVLLGVCAYMVTQLLQALFNSAGHTRYNLIVLATGLGGTAIGGCLLVPRYGAMGGGWTALASYVTMTLIAIYIGKKKFDLELRAMLIPRPALIRQLLQQFSRKKK